MLNFFFHSFLPLGREKKFTISFSDPLPFDVTSYRANFEGLGVANLTLKNPYTLVGVNPSKFTVCIISLIRYLDYCT